MKPVLLAASIASINYTIPINTNATICLNTLTILVGPDMLKTLLQLQ